MTLLKYHLIHLCIIMKFEFAIFIIQGNIPPIRNKQISDLCFRINLNNSTTPCRPKWHRSHRLRPVPMCKWNHHVQNYICVARGQQHLKFVFSKQKIIKNKHIVNKRTCRRIKIVFGPWKCKHTSGIDQWVNGLILVYYIQIKNSRLIRRTDGFLDHY